MAGRDGLVVADLVVVDGLDVDRLRLIPTACSVIHQQSFAVSRPFRT